MPFEQGPIRNFIGQGLTFPIELENGKGVLKTGFELIRSSIKVILSWPYNHRFFLAEFGSRLEELLEEPNDDILRNVITTFIVDSLSTWEKRIEVISTDVQRDDMGTIMINLNYKIVNSQLRDNFIFPFYKKIIY